MGPRHYFMGFTNFRARSDASEVFGLIVVPPSLRTLTEALGFGVRLTWSTWARCDRGTNRSVSGSESLASVPHLMLGWQCAVSVLTIPQFHPGAIGAQTRDTSKPELLS